MRNTLFTLLLFLLFASSAASAEMKFKSGQNAESFLENRQILCTVNFDVNSTQLSSAAKDIISKTVPQLRQLDLDAKLLRIEGFASPEGDKQKNFRLSIDRALAVESFLRVNHGVLLDHYITGYGPTTPVDISAAGTRRVEIATYDNPWSQVNTPVKLSNGQ